METPSPETTQDETTAPDWTKALPPELLAALGVPADQVTPESVQNALAALVEKATGADALAAKLADVQLQLGNLQAAEQQRLAAEIDAELAAYDLDEATATVVKSLSPEKRKPLLGVLPKKTQEKPKAKTQGQPAAIPPPKPQHDPQRNPAETADEGAIAAKIKARAQELTKADPRLAWGAAYAQAEKEVRAGS